MSFWQDIDDFSGLDTYTDQNLIALENYRFINPKRSWSIYINNKPQAKREATKWADCNPPAGWGVANHLPESGSCLRVRHAGFQHGTCLGYIKYSYYVTYKGQAYGQ